MRDLWFWAVAMLCLPVAALAQALDIEAMDAEAEWQVVRFGPEFEAETGQTLDVYFELAVPEVPGVFRVEHAFDDPDAVARFAWITGDNALIEAVTVMVAQGRDGPVADPLEEAHGAIDAFLRARIEGPLPEELGHRSRTLAGWRIAEWAGRQRLDDGRMVMVRIACVPLADNFSVICLSGRSSDAILPPGDAPDFLGFNFTTLLVTTLKVQATRDVDGVMQPL